MRRLFLALIVAVVLLAALIAGKGWERFVAGILRPWAEARAAATLAAEVRCGRLELGWDRLELNDVQVARPGELQLKVERIVVRYTLAGLWQRRLERLELHRPELAWQQVGTKDKSAVKPWPQQSPLRVDEWEVADGLLQLTFGPTRLQLGQVEASGSLGSAFRVEASARLGKEAGVPLSLSGHGRWSGAPEFTFTRLLWAERSLLPSPVTVIPGAGLLDATIALEHLDATEARSLLAALDRPTPWPEGLAWQVSSLRVAIASDGQETDLRLDAASGEGVYHGQRWPWESLCLRLNGTGGRWAIDAAATLPARAQGHFTGLWNESLLLGNWQLAMPEPAQLSTALGLASPAALRELRALSIAGEMRAATGGRVEGKGRLTANWSGATTLAGTLTGHWQDGTVGIEGGGLTLEDSSGPLARASLRLSGRPAQRDWRGNWRLQVPDLLRLAPVLAGPPPGGVPNLRDLDLQGELVSAGDRLALPVTGVNGQLAGAGMSGKVDGKLLLSQVAGGWQCEIQELAVTGLEYATPDGLAGVTGGALRLAGTLGWQGDLTFALRGEAVAGEALAGSWYADLDGLPLRFTVAGGWLPATGQVGLREGRLDLAGLATTEVQGTLAGKRVELAGTVAVPRLDGAFQAGLRQLAGGAVPGLDRLALSGRLATTFAGEWQPDGWQLLATVRPAGVTLAGGDDLRLAGLGGELPLLLQRGAAPAVAARRTALTWDALQLGPLAASGGSAALTAGANRWQFEEPLRLTAGGGRIDLAGLALAFPASGPEIRTSVTATGIDLAELSRSLGWPVLAGHLAAELPGVRLTREAASIDGEARLELFGGEVKLRNMRLEQPFSRYRVSRGDLDFTGIDLQRLTETFAFGEVNGIADGYVHGLSLFGAVPTAFDASFTTRETNPRNISVKAIHNLNTLSQGGLTAALSQGVYRFIDFYRYRRIGIRCRLHNDLFHLVGTAREGTSTYLIDGGWLPPRIDVIVSSPTIAFQEMVKRLKRVQRAGH